MLNPLSCCSCTGRNRIFQDAKAFDEKCRRYPTILQTPLSAGGVIDSYVWNFSRNGIFTVRSGYGGAEHLLTTSNGQTSAGKSSHSDSANHIWKEIWRF